MKKKLERDWINSDLHSQHFFLEDLSLGTICCAHKTLNHCFEYEHKKRRVRPGHRENSCSFARPYHLRSLLSWATLCRLFWWSLDVCWYFRQAQKGCCIWISSRCPQISHVELGCGEGPSQSQCPRMGCVELSCDPDFLTFFTQYVQPQAHL